MRTTVVLAAVALAFTSAVWFFFQSAIPSHANGTGTATPPTGSPAAAQPGTSPAAQPGPTPAAAGGAVPAARDSFAAERDSLMQVVLRSIAGREDAPAESVFHNIKLMKGMPAGRLVRVMNLGYGRSLGVRCAHCHVVGEWDKDDKPQKQVARDMAVMTQTINRDLLAKIENLEGEPPTVNCTTCHRGARKPALNL